MPTAETIDAGQVTVNDYEIFVIGVTYGFTDDIQISASTLLPIVENMPLVLLASGKQRVVSSDHLIFSMQPNLLLGHHDGYTAGGFGLQLLLDYVVDDEGDFVVSLGQSTQFAFGEDFDDDVSLANGALFSLGLGASWRVARIVKLMGELVLPGGLYWGDNNAQFEVIEQALLFNYGIRFFGESIAVDLSFLRPLHPDVDNSFVMGIPWLTFSARF
jgi:hypothetical protein